MAYTADDYRISLEQYLSGELMVNTFAVKDTSGVRTVDSVAEEAGAAFAANWSPIQSENLRYDRVVAKRLGGDLAQGEHALTQEGGSAAVALPNSVALAISLRTALSSRRGRGRFFLGGFTTDFVDTAEGSLITTAAQTAMEGIMQDMIDELDGDDLALSVNSAMDSTLRPVTQFIIGRRFDVQRRRMPAGR